MDERKQEKTQEKRKGDVLHRRRSGRRERWGKRGRWTETIIALSYHCTVINSPSRWGVQAQAGTALDEKPFPPYTAACAI